MRSSATLQLMNHTVKQRFALVLGLLFLFGAPVVHAQNARQLRERLQGELDPVQLDRELSADLEGLPLAELMVYRAKLEGLKGQTPRNWPKSLWTLQLDRARSVVDEQLTDRSLERGDTLQAIELLSRSLSECWRPTAASRIAELLYLGGERERAIGLLISGYTVRPEGTLLSDAKVLFRKSGGEVDDWEDYAARFRDSYLEMLVRTAVAEASETAPELTRYLGDDNGSTVVALWDESMHRQDAAGLRELQSRMQRGGKELRLVYCGGNEELARQQARRWGLELPTRGWDRDSGLRDALGLKETPAVCIFDAETMVMVEAPNRELSDTVQKLLRRVSDTESDKQDGREE